MRIWGWRMTDLLRRYRVGITSVLRRCAACAIVVIGSSLPGAAQANEPPLCDTSNPYMSELCRVIQTQCLPYLENPASVSPDDVVPVPRTLRRYFESALNTHELC